MLVPVWVPSLNGLPFFTPPCPIFLLFSLFFFSFHSLLLLRTINDKIPILGWAFLNTGREERHGHCHDGLRIHSIRLNVFLLKNRSVIAFQRYFLESSHLRYTRAKKHPPAPITPNQASNYRSPDRPPGATPAAPQKNRPVIHLRRRGRLSLSDS